MYIRLDRAILFVEQEKIEPPVHEYFQTSQGRTQGLQFHAFVITGRIAGIGATVSVYDCKVCENVLNNK
jgi:hypothetical protein